MTQQQNQVKTSDIDSLFDKVESQYSRNRQITLESIEKKYSELNHGELLVATGSFALITNFLFEVDLAKCVPLLYCGVGMFAITIILKSFLYRKAVDRGEKELRLGDEVQDLNNELKRILKKSASGKQLTDIELKSLANYDNDTEMVLNKRRGLEKTAPINKFLNDVEFLTYVLGILSIFLFFVLNTK